MKPASSFTAITSEGGLLPADFLAELLAPKTAIEGLTPVSYNLAEGERISEQVNRSWNRLKGRWTDFKKAIADKQPGESTTTETRDRWLHPIFQELGFGQKLPTARAIEIDGRSYSVSHGWSHVPIHLVGSHVDIDRRTPGAVGAAKASPHSLVQQVLNASDGHLWGIVSNGLNFRLLRDSIALTRMSYVEWDLAAIFDGDLYSEFFVLWLVAHQSRFDAERPEQCWLERWKKSAEDKGLRALENLYPGVKTAIAALGTGLVSHAANTALREKLRTGRLTTQEFYRQILRVIYRLLFLFVAEDRGLLHPPDESEAALKARRRYLDFYSITRLRALTLYRTGTPHPDLWHVFQFVTGKLGSDIGCPELALPPLGSFLWTVAQSTPDLLDSLIANRLFLEAVHALAFVRDGNVRRAVDYKNLGSEELGSVYQGLLEMHPRINAEVGIFELDIAAGNERKTSGSYYTPDSLVQCLLDSALEPVIAERLAKAKTPKEKDTALLSLKVCDMAAGSGHFILRAAHRIARHLARERSGEEEPGPSVYQTALRDVIGHSLYGVDINPMSVELCKVTLWLEALEPGKPLSFLDHHIRCGNSLLGATPELIKGGIPDEAYASIEGDDKEACSTLKKKNKRENPKLGEWFMADEAAIRDRLHQAATQIDEIGDSLPEDIRRKEAAFRAAQANYDFQRARDLADLWCAAFVIKKHFPESAVSESAILAAPAERQPGLFGGAEEIPKAKTKKTKMPRRASSEILMGITTQHLRDFVEERALPGGLLAEAKRLADQYQFFHFHLAFPEVFAQGGFDVSLGNPPWERVKLQEKEWFAERRPEIANAPNAAARKRLIEALRADEPALFQQFLDDSRKAEGESHFLRDSGLYPLCGRGDINLYAVFTEGMRHRLSPAGRMGTVLPSGIATDDTTKFFFQDVVEKNSLRSLFDFENRNGIFEGVHRSYKFCLFTSGSAQVATVGRTPQPAEFAFFCLGVEDLRDPNKRFVLSSDDIALLNPNTRTCSIFRLKRDAELTLAIYRRIPVFISGDSEAANPWQAWIRQGLYHMTNDGNAGFIRGLHEQSFEFPVPLYEGKMFWQFDHHFAIWHETERECLEVAPTAKHSCTITAEYVVERSELEGRIAAQQWTKQWFFAFRNITNTTNERTVVATILPRLAPVYSIRVLFRKLPDRKTIGLLANFNSMPFDYAARQKLGGTNLSDYITHQLPVFAPDRYSATSLWSCGQENVLDWLLPRVLELTYTAWDLEAFAQDCGWPGPPFRWDVERRFLLRCELDAAFFHLYLGPETEWRQQPAALTEAFPTPRAAVSYILDTFPIVKRKDEAKWGDYRTKRVILEIYDALSEAMRTGQPFIGQLEVPPAHIRTTHLPRLPSTTRDTFPAAPLYSEILLPHLLPLISGGVPLPLLDAAFGLLADRAELARAAASFDEGRRWAESFRQPVTRADLRAALLRLAERGIIHARPAPSGPLLTLDPRATPASDPWIAADAWYSLRAALDQAPTQPAAEPELADLAGKIIAFAA